MESLSQSVPDYTDRLLTNQIARKPVRINWHIIMEEIDIIQENYQVDLWKINVIHYVTVVTLFEKEGKIRDVNTRINRKEKQGWQIIV